MIAPTVADIFAARRRLAPFLRPTPLLPSAWLSSLAGGPVRLKLESVNLTGSFKIRGALNAALRLREATTGEVPRLVTASAGNHGRALALASEMLGLVCTVFTPTASPAAKKDAIRGHGAELMDDCPDYDAAEARARALASDTAAVYVSPYNHPDVIAGAGTIGIEIAEAVPDVQLVVVPLGGGGLFSGIGLALRAAAPGATLAGVEVEVSSPFTAGLAVGHIVTIDAGASIADGLTGNLEPGALTFAMVQRTIDTVVTVGEADVAAAMRGLGAHERLIAEGAGATATAALVAGRLAGGRRPTVVLVTGSNVDLPKWLAVAG